MSEIHKRHWLVVIMVLTMLPLPLLVKMPTWGLATSVWQYVSAVSGYVGLVMLLWMYILGTKSVMGLYFSDLGPVLGIHKWLGKWGTLLIFLHPLAATISYGDNILTYTLLPEMDGSFERSVTWGRFALYALGGYRQKRGAFLPSVRLYKYQSTSFLWCSLGMPLWSLSRVRI